MIYIHTFAKTKLIKIMKNKLFLFALSLIYTISIFGQDESNKNESFKPKKNNLSFEVNFIPFSSSGPISINGLSGRYFVSDKLAIKVLATYSHSNYNDETPLKLLDAMYFETEEAKTTTFGIGTGFEYHLFDFKRISPYVGATIGFENKSSSSSSLEYTYEYDYQYDSYEVTEVETEVENAWYNQQIMGYDGYGNPIYGYSIYQRAYTAFSAAVILGADVYITKHLYMGIEIGLGFKNVANKEVIIKEEGNIEYKYPETKAFNSGFVYNNAIRLGFWL